MLCPMCNGQTKVTNSRPEDDCVNRRRECLDCHYRFSTVEVDVDYIKSIKNMNTVGENK